MIYGLYLSASGVLASSYRQDVIANNLANSETVGFKKDLALLQERSPASQERNAGPNASDPLLDRIGGGLFTSPTAVDTTQGSLEATGTTLDLAIEGNGFFSLDTHNGQRLTRNGQFQLDRTGNLVAANDWGDRVLDPEGKPIRLDPSVQAEISPDGSITQAGKVVGRVGMYDVPSPQRLVKDGQSMLTYPDMKALTAGSGTMRSGYIERSNVDPTTELTGLMEAERQLEANTNMIRYQDATLSALVNSVGKIS